MRERDCDKPAVSFVSTEGGGGVHGRVESASEAASANWLTSLPVLGSRLVVVTPEGIDFRMRKLQLPMTKEGRIVRINSSGACWLISALHP